jgi:predicted dehydrogenase
VRAGYLGRIFHATAATLIGPTSFPAVSQPVMLEQLPGGILSGAGSHLLDLVMSLAGPLEAVSASCVRHVDEPPLLVRRGARTARVHPDDSTALLARLAGGAQAMVHLSVVAVGRPTSGFMRIEMHGDRGALLHELCVGPGASRLLACPLGGARFETVDIPDRLRQGLDLDNLSMDRIIPHCFRGIASELLAAIREHRPAMPGFDEGARSQAVIDAALDSSRRGRWVTVGSR